MEYILDRVEKQEDGFISKKSFFIQNSSISYINERMDKLTFPRVNADGFILTPGHIMHDFSILDCSTWDDYRKRIGLLISKGCTTVITFSPIQYEQQVSDAIRKARHKMINSSIDFVVCISTRTKVLTPTLIRKCKREKIPMIRLKFETEEDLLQIPWTRIKEAMLTYQIVIIPDFESLPLNAKEKRRSQLKWKELANSHRIPTFENLPDELTPYPKRLVKRIGLFPRKGELMTGSDVDYNLYTKAGFVANDQEVEPDVVVIRGTIVKAGSKLYVKPGFGRECIIRLPGHFVSIDDA